MPNPVFRLTARSLSKVVSGRTAETMLSASLRDLKLSPDTVTARDMQRVLSGPLERRLSLAIPGTAAFDKLRALSRRLERLDAKVDLSDDSVRTVIWDQEDTDTHWSDEQHQLGAPPPTQALGRPRAAGPPSLISSNISPSPVNFSPSTSNSTVFSSAFASVPGPAALQPGPAPLEASPSPPPPAQSLALSGQNEESVNDLSANPPINPSPDDATDLEVGSEFSADDFEFSDPDYVHLQAAVKRYELLTTEGRDALLYELARHPGVQTVVLCSMDGQVLNVRAPQGAPQLGSVVAATAMLFRQRELRLLSADLGNATVCMRVVGNYCVALLARGSVNVGRLLSELQQIEVSA